MVIPTWFVPHGALVRLPVAQTQCLATVPQAAHVWPPQYLTPLIPMRTTLMLHLVMDWI